MMAVGRRAHQQPFGCTITRRKITALPARVRLQISLWSAVVRHFRALDRRPPTHVPFFNGNLFKPHFTETILISDEWLAIIKNELVELPEEKKNRLQKEYGLKEEIAEQLISDLALVNFAEEVFKNLKIELAPNAAGWIVSELLKNINSRQENIADLKFTPVDFAQLIILINDGKITSNGGQEVLSQMVESGEKPVDIIKKAGLEKISDAETIKKIAAGIIEKFPEQTAQYRAGKLPLLAFFLGKVMAETGGQADPELAKKILTEILSQ